MKRSVSALCLLASALGVNALAQTAETPSAPVPVASTAPAGTSKVAVIAFEAAVAQTNEGQRNISQIRDKFDPKQKELKTKSDEIESLKKALQSSGSTLGDSEKATRTHTIDEKEKILQRDAEAAQTDFNSEMNDMYQALAQKVFGVAQAYAAQNGFTLLLDASAGGQQQAPTILWASDAANITVPVIQAYNTKSGIAAPPASATPATGASTRPSTAPRTTRPATTTTKP